MFNLKPTALCLGNFVFTFFLLSLSSTAVQATYTNLIGVYTTDSAAEAACSAHRQHPTDGCSGDPNTTEASPVICASQDIRWHNGQPGYPNIWPDRYYAISTEDCGATCPSGWTDNGQGQCIENVACPVGDKQRFHGDAGEPIPSNVCSNGCWYENEYVDVPVTFKMGTHAWSGNFISTGESCGAGGPGGPPDNPPTNCLSDSYGNTFCAGIGPDNAPPNCMQDGNGNQACIDAYDPQNCGYLNGELKCYDDYPDKAECYFIPGGSYICFPGSEEPQSPPYPDTGTPGQPAVPDIQMESGNPDAPGPIDYFNPDTVDQSSGEGGAPGPTSDKTPEETINLELDGPIEIDESSVPGPVPQGEFEAILDAAGYGQVQQEIEDLGTGDYNPIPDVPTSFSDLDTLIPQPGQCQDPQIVFFGHTMNIPIVSKGDGFRDLMGWLFYALTALYLFGLLMDLPKKIK